MLWLAVDKDLNSLGVEEAETSEQAFYQFMKYSLYPANVIELPDSVVLRTELDDALDEVLGPNER